MKLHSAHITNFKLLEDVELIFSSDPARPLTVVRAENGSGKTSILQALRWCIWGERGISQRMSLTSASGAAGKPVTVQVWIEFSERDRYSGADTTYRLTRTCQETRAEGDRFERGSERSRLLRLTDQGDSEIRDGHDAIISAMLPRKLADVFFTDGDVVQNFVTDQTERDRQEYVHEAIRHLLGFDEVELAEQRLRTISRSFRQKVSESGSEALRNAEIDLEKAEEDLESKKEDRTHLLQRINEVEQQIREDDRELGAIKGIGDLEAIQAQINQIGKDIKELDDHEDDIRQQMKDLLQAEELSNCLLRRHLEAGAAALAELEDRNVIPGMSVGLLHDRLELGVCICGARLNDGDRQHAHILDLIERQRQTEPRIQRLTALRHEARSIGIGSSLPLSGGTVTSLRERVEALRTQYTQCKDRQRQKEGDLRALRERREQIDANRVRQLTERLRSSRLKKSDFDRSRGHIEGQISALEDQVRVCTERVRDARRREQLSHTLTRRSHVADDLLALTAGILNRLKTHYVHRVSERMNQLFLARIHRRTGMDGVRTAEGGEGVTGAMIRARIWVDGRLAGGLQALLGAPMAAYSGCGERDGGIGHGKRRSRTGLARVCGDVGLAGGSVADGRRQAGSGMARSRARARLNCSSQGQRRGRCRVNRRAERVIRPAKAKTRRLRVLVVTIC